MSNVYFFLYLIYGSVFINMGIFAVQKKEDEVSNFPLVKSLKYLGFFGITHGLSEWATMLVITGLYSDAYVYLFIIKQILKAISFGCLLLFGLSLSPLRRRLKRIGYILPGLLFAVWLIGFSSLMFRFGLDYHHMNPEYNIIFLRYILGFSGGISSAIAMYLNAKHLKERNLLDIAKRYRNMAHIFFVYGFLDGLFVRRMDFFPASIINNDLFMSVFGFPIQIGKITVGVALTYMLIGVIKTFSWEQKEKLRQLQKSTLVLEERRKLGMEIHDSILQGLYSAGLKVEYLLKNRDEQKNSRALLDIKTDLRETINKTRDFLVTTASETRDIETLQESLEKLVKDFEKSQNVVFKLEYRIPALTLFQLSSEKSTHIYYIVQEALMNVSKHAKATQVNIYLEASYRHLHVKIWDNGIGIKKQYNKNEHFGIQSMEERVKRLKGQLRIERVKNGTSVEIIVPWEEGKDEQENKGLTSG